MTREDSRTLPLTQYPAAKQQQTTFPQPTSLTLTARRPM